MYTAKFLYNIFEEKYAINPYHSFSFKGDDWRLADEHCGVSYSLGYKANNIMRYVKLRELDVIFHEENISIEFERGNIVKVGKETVEIIEVIRNLDGSIDYLTDKVEYVPLNTRKTYFDERTDRNEETEETPPAIQEESEEYENNKGAIHKFWNRLFGK